MRRGEATAHRYFCKTPMVRLLTLLTIASLEATIVSLPLLALTAFGLPWPFLLVLVLLGIATDEIARRVPPHYERPALGIGAALAVLLLLSRQFAGPLGGLAAFLPGSGQIFSAYALTLLALFLFWRGTRTSTRDSLGVSSLFGRGAAAILLALLFGPLFNTGAPANSAPVLAHIVGFVSLSLMAMALTHAEGDPGNSARRLGWRWMATLGLAIAAIILVSILAVALLGGGTAIGAAQNLIRLIIFPIALLGGLIAYVLVVFIGQPLAELLRQALARMQLLQNLAPPPDQPPPGSNDQAMFEAVTRLADGATFLMALIPLVILVAAILLLRGRRRQAKENDEQRESLGVASSLASDLRDLLGRLRNPFARSLQGLRAALAALSGDDPATRVRRAYVRFLLRLEERERPRQPAQTPAELATSLDAPQPLAALTASYERARYNPAGVPAAEAEAAERALDSIERA